MTFATILKLYLGGICQAIFKAEILLQDMIDASNNVGDDRLRCVINALFLPRTRVVDGKECLV